MIIIINHYYDLLRLKMLTMYTLAPVIFIKIQNIYHFLLGGYKIIKLLLTQSYFYLRESSLYSKKLTDAQ